jgi:hypothetical protein
MRPYTSFEELEASVPLSQLRPSAAFGLCAAHLPPDVDSLHGDDLVSSLESALSIHSKARVVLQCWVLLIMRRRVDARCEKDALYARLQQTAVSPQEKIRYRRGAMLLCHLLVEREAAEANSLLDRYLVDFFFPWSSAVNDKDDAYYLQGDVVHWVRQALDYLKQNGNKMTAAKWSELICSSASLTPLAAGSHDAPLPRSPRQDPLHSLAALATTATAAFEPTPLAPRTRSQDSDRGLSDPPLCFPTHHETRPSSTQRRKKRRSTGASSELETLKKTIEVWAKRLRRQLLRAARVDDKAQIRQVANELQAPPLAGKAERCEDEVDSEHESDRAGDSDDGQRRADHPSTSTDGSDDSDNSSSLPEHLNECSVCEAEPKRMEQVWNVSCRHGFCGECMLARLSQRERKCMYCRTKITQVVDASGQVYQHYDWTRWWRGQGSPAMSSS